MSYSFSLPIQSDKDRVRLLLRDVDPARPLYQDEDLDEFLNLSGGGVASAAIAAAQSAAFAFARIPDVTIGDQKISYTGAANACRLIAQDLRQQANESGGARLYAGGIDPSEQAQDLLDPSIVSPWFTRVTGDDRGATFPSMGTFGTTTSYGPDSAVVPQP